MKFNKIIISSLLLCAAVTLSAQQVMDLGKSSAWDKNAAVQELPGGGLLVPAGKGKVLLTGKFFPVDPAKTYTLEFKAVSKTPGRTSRILAGFEGFLNKGNPISSLSVRAVPGSFGELLSDAPKGSRSIRISNASGIEPRPHYHLMADAKKDFSDLPNKTRVSGNLTKVDKSGNVWTLTFKTPFTRSLKKGEGVRLHCDGGYMYTAGVRTVTNRETVMKGSIKGYAEPGTYDFHKWPVKTKLGRVVLLLNWNNDKKVETLLKEIKLTVR